MSAANIFVSSFLVALSGALMPGPLLTVTIAQSAKRGFIASVLIVAGHALSEMLLVIGLVFGLGGVLRLKSAMVVIAVVGGLMLLWMGWGMIRDAWRGSVDLENSAAGAQETSTDGVVSSARLVLSGMVVSISNPYWVLWWATIGLAGLTFFKTIAASPVLGLGAFYVGHISGDILWYLAVGMAVVTGRRLISPRIYRGIVAVCGFFLLFLGSSFLYLVASGGIGKISMAMDWIKR